MDKEIIYTENAPEPGNYSQAIKFEDLVFVSGQTADDPESGKAVHGTVAEQTEMILINIKNILKAAGSSMQDVLKVNVYITNMEDKPEMDRVYKKFFNLNPPARIVMAVKGLDAGLNVEIDVIAKLSSN